jgi:hypothetical protein
MKSIQTIKKKSGSVLLLIILSMILSACIGAVPTNIPADEEERILAETMQALPTELSPTLLPAPTLTLVSATPNPPTATALPAPAFSLPAATRISFAAGTTYGAARGTIEPGQTQNFVLEAQQGQPMLASVASPENDVTMSIITESGVTLLPASQGWSNWQGTLPATQEYFIQIIGGASQEDYSLWVSIPSRIQFAPGATSALVSGQTADGNIASYVLAAQGGQTMNIVLTPEPNVAALTVWGFNDGQPYMRAQMGSITFNMQLPSTQDYIIDVVPQAGQEVNFTLRVEIQ